MGAAIVALFVLATAAATTRATGPAPMPMLPDRLADAAAAGAAAAAASAPSDAAPPAVPSASPAAAPPAPALTVAAGGPAQGEVVMAPPPERFEAHAKRVEPAPEPAPPPQFDATTPPGTGTGTWAVIVGINDYPGTASDLRSAVNDADDTDLALAGMGVPTAQRLVLRDGQATAGHIREAVEWLVARAGPDATAVFFYGGHVRKLGVTSEALIGADGELLTDLELGERLSHLLPHRAWIAIAGCYGGGFTEVLAPGRILTGAAPADALAYESSRFGRSFLVQYMIRQAMIDQRAAGSVQAAFSYAVAELARDHPDRLPVQIDLALAPLDLRPVLAAAVPAPAPVPVPAPVTPPSTAPCRQLLLFACRS
ncbi:MAG TPA: caspase family protein [Acidimicrobiales bacterium]|nr:caspase family protein [Acidimicrobiales bacterium]